MLMAELEGMKLRQEEMKKMIADLGGSIESTFRETLSDELDRREYGGTGYAQLKEIMDKLSKLESLLEKPPPATLLQQRTDTDDDDGYDNGGGFLAEEDDIILTLEEDNTDTTTTNNAARRQSTTVEDAIVRKRTNEQMKRRTITMGNHHGGLNPLPSSWVYPKALPIIHLMTLWLIGNQRENVPPLRMLEPRYVYHFDKKGRTLSEMKQVMEKIKEFGQESGVWLSNTSEWNGSTVTTLWSTIWGKLDPYLRTESMSKNGTIELEKSRNGQIEWRTCYNKMSDKGLLQGNKVRKKKKKKK